MSNENNLNANYNTNFVLIYNLIFVNVCFYVLFIHKKVLRLQICVNILDI